VIDSKVYTVTYASGPIRRAGLTAGEAVALVKRIRSDWQSSGAPGGPDIKIWYRDGSLVAFADLERSL
jgi:hypothetical protein